MDENKNSLEEKSIPLDLFMEDLLGLESSEFYKKKIEESSTFMNDYIQASIFGKIDGTAQLKQKNMVYGNKDLFRGMPMYSLNVEKLGSGLNLVEDLEGEIGSSIFNFYVGEYKRNKYKIFEQKQEKNNEDRFNVKVNVANFEKVLEDSPFTFYLYLKDAENRKKTKVEEKEIEVIKTLLIKFLKKKDYKSLTEKPENIFWIFSISNFFKLENFRNNKKFRKAVFKHFTYLVSMVGSGLLNAEPILTENSNLFLWEMFFEKYKKKLSDKNSDLYEFIFNRFWERFGGVPKKLLKILEKEAVDKNSKSKKNIQAQEIKKKTTANINRTIKKPEPKKNLSISKPKIEFSAKTLTHINFFEASKNKNFKFFTPIIGGDYDLYIKVSRIRNGQKNTIKEFDWKKLESNELCDLSEIYGKKIEVEFLVLTKDPKEIKGKGALEFIEKHISTSESYENLNKDILRNTDKKNKTREGDLNNKSENKPEKVLQDKALAEKINYQDQEETFYLYLLEENFSTEIRGNLLEITLPQNEEENEGLGDRKIIINLKQKPEEKFILKSFLGEKKYEVRDSELKSELLKLYKENKKILNENKKSEEERDIKINLRTSFSKMYLNQKLLINEKIKDSDLRNKNGVYFWQLIVIKKFEKKKEEILKELRNSGYEVEFVKEKTGNILFLEGLKIIKNKGEKNEVFIEIACGKEMKNFNIRDEKTRNTSETLELQTLGKMILSSFCLITMEESDKNKLENINTFQKKEAGRSISEKDKIKMVEDLDEKMATRLRKGEFGEFEKEEKCMHWDDFTEYSQEVLARRSSIHVQTQKNNGTKFNAEEYINLRVIFSKAPNFKQYFIRRCINTYKSINGQSFNDDHGRKSIFPYSVVQDILEEVFEEYFTEEEINKILEDELKTFDLLKKDVIWGDMKINLWDLILDQFEKKKIGVLVVGASTCNIKDLKKIKIKIEEKKKKKNN